MRHWLLVIAFLAGFATPFALAQPAQPYPEDPELPEGFSDTLIATGITGATALAVAPDGRLFVCEQTGALRVIKDDRLLPAPFVKVEVDSFWERGLIGVTLDPEFPRNPFVYLCYVAPGPYPHHRISRFTARGDAVVPKSEVILLEGDDQTKLGGAQPAGHQGGALHFGKVGKLYIAIGEQTAGTPAQRLDTFQGKLLRINKDGSIPPDNPFVRTASGKYRAIWALGLRNPFAFAVQPGTGRIFIDDVGNSRLEEINEGVAGANYGWPESEGPTTKPGHRGPLFAYDHNVGRSITGGTFYNPPVRQFPERYVGKYFFMDYMDHWMRVLDPKAPNDVEVFATGLAGPVDVVTAPDGSLYYLNRKAWVKDEQFQPHTGSVHRISYPARSGKPVPHITAQPEDLTVAEGQTSTLCLTATGGPPLRFRWFKNGAPLSGADGSRLALPAMTLADTSAEFRCVVTNSLGSTRSRRVRLGVLPLREAVRRTTLVPGLNFECYEGRWEGLPDFTSLRPVKTGFTGHVDLAVKSREENFGLVFQGYLHASADGVYTFFLAGTAIGKLFLGDTEVVSKVGSRANREVSGQVALKAGRHPFRLLFTHHAGRPSLEVRYCGPGVTKQVPGDACFSRCDPAVLDQPVIHPAGGAFTGPLHIRLTSLTPVAAIRYTTDGTTPSPHSPFYKQPFQLATSAAIRAKSFQGALTSGETTANFTITGNVPYGLPPRQPVTTLNVPSNAVDLPPLLSQTGVFRSLRDLTPNPGIIGYDVNAPLWSDGAVKRRWMALPGEERVGFAAIGEWRFPAGTVFIKHFELPHGGPRLETRLLVVDQSGIGFGVTYRWRADQRDADLLATGLTEEVSRGSAAGARMVKWSFPSRNDCLACHTASAGFVLGVKTRQLNRPVHYPETGVTNNQLRAWNQLGMLQPALQETDIPGLARLAGMADTTASLDHRVRSYLDANCAHCHRPGGARGLFDARLDIPLSRQNLVHGPVAAADLGVPAAELVMPGSLGRSLLYERMRRRQDVFNMPPLATNQADIEALKVLAEWINHLPRTQGQAK